jgi:hypothetical protein
MLQPGHDRRARVYLYTGAFVPRASSASPIPQLGHDVVRSGAWTRGARSGLELALAPTPRWTELRLFLSWQAKEPLFQNLAPSQRHAYRQQRAVHPAPSRLKRRHRRCQLLSMH